MDMLLELPVASFKGAALVLVAYFVCNQVESWLIVPRLMDRAVHIHPGLIFLGLCLGGECGAQGGFPGAMLGILLSVPVMIIVQSIWLVWCENDLDDTPKREGPNLLQRLAQRILAVISTR